MKKYRVVITLLLLMLPAVTYAVFKDIETSSGNTFSADTLDVRFVTADSRTFELEPNTPVVLQTWLKNKGNLPNNNNLTYRYYEGSTELADKIQLNGTSLPLYQVNDIHLSNGENYELLLTFSISQDDYDTHRGESVTFYIRDIANQEGLTYPNGFNDIEEMRFEISIPSLTPTELQDTESISGNLVDLFLEESNLVEEI